MFIIKADALSAILDKVAPHSPAGAEDLNMVVLDCSRGWLHAAAGGRRTLAVARTRVDGAHWTAPLGFDDVCALRGWLESSDQVHVEHTTHEGLPVLHFSEGTAQLTVPVATYMASLSWRSLLLAEARPSSYQRATVRLSAEDLELWQHAGEDVELIPATGRAAFIVTAGPDFIGLQMPRPRTPGGDALTGWATSVRSRRFLYDGLPYEVGASYADRRGFVWRITARPAPGEEPLIVSADRSSVVLPLAVVLSAGGPLLRLPE
ncbi:phiSA1p31-related protein [Streptomyces sp. Isolate_219]|uniref:phiSA1p31-related protein n=1 Tax=Streptomyces sp. Isolate_219 TaxID=2950110 RepID=UPI0021C82AC6|nr:phiSA1p31-related protein [Streptomyces sp. Isolate_219]MCR8573057.1 phiSA1p31-related protein [Streptomyces sp. Isolate_219]